MSRITFCIFVVAAAAILTLDCSDDGASTSTRAYSVSGSVRLDGMSRDETGDGASGRMSAYDATGVWVYLIAGVSKADSATTSEGRFVFGGVKPGTYFIMGWVVPSLPVETPPFTVTSSNVTLADTLLLEPFGSLKAYPSPADPSDGECFNLDYVLTEDAHMSITVHDIGRTQIRTVLDAYAGAGPHSWLWCGEDTQGYIVAPGQYWVVAAITPDGVNYDYSYDLVFRVDRP